MDIDSQAAVYVHEPEVHNLAAPSKVVPILVELLQPKSVLDVGCGIGTWLKCFADAGIDDHLGLDGDHVDRALLASHLAPERFRTFDLTQPFDLGRSFDLVLSLEVAEHLPAASASGFVGSLTAHGDTVVFSAALPGQGGQNHVNEQWKHYWIKLFAARGFALHDILRPRIWGMQGVDWWYQQNMLVFSRQDLSSLMPRGSAMLDVIHPELFIQNQDYIVYLQEQLAEAERRLHDAGTPAD